MIEYVLARVGAPHIRLRQWFRIKIAKTGQTFHKSGPKGRRDKRRAKEKSSMSRCGWRVWQRNLWRTSGGRLGRLGRRSRWDFDYLASHLLAGLKLDDRAFRDRHVGGGSIG